MLSITLVSSATGERLLAVPERAQGGESRGLGRVEVGFQLDPVDFYATNIVVVDDPGGRRFNHPEPDGASSLSSATASASVLSLLQNALVLESSLLLSGNGRSPSHRSRREEFLDGHRLPERSVGSSVSDAEAPLAQDPAYGVLAMRQSSARCRTVERR